MVKLEFSISNGAIQVFARSARGWPHGPYIVSHRDSKPTPEDVKACSLVLDDAAAASLLQQLHNVMPHRPSVQAFLDEDDTGDEEKKP